MSLVYYYYYYYYYYYWATLYVTTQCFYTNDVIQTHSKI